MSEMRLYLGIFRVDGIPFTERRYAQDRKSANFWFLQTIRMRNAQVQHEKTVPVRLMAVGNGPGDDITPADADRLEAANTVHKRNEGLPSPFDVDPDYANRMLYEPINDTIWRPDPVAA